MTSEDALAIVAALAPALAGIIVGAVAQLWKKRTGFYWWAWTTAAGYAGAFALDRVLRSFEPYRDMIERAAWRATVAEIGVAGIAAGLVLLLGVATLPRATLGRDSNALKRPVEPR